MLILKLGLINLLDPNSGLISDSSHRSIPEPGPDCESDDQNWEYSILICYGSFVLSIIMFSTLFWYETLGPIPIADKKN